MGLDIIKCPHCGFMYQMDLIEYKKERETKIAKGLFGRDELKLESLKYVDLKCPQCGKEFEWKVE
jgi:predicted RNA-binding Zn-ribbon protein involved in translation (DUF1610 family)